MTTPINNNSISPDATLKIIQTEAGLLKVDGHTYRITRLRIKDLGGNPGWTEIDLKNASAEKLDGIATILADQVFQKILSNPEMKEISFRFNAKLEGSLLKFWKAPTLSQIQDIQIVTTDSAGKETTQKIDAEGYDTNSLGAISTRLGDIFQIAIGLPHLPKKSLTKKQPVPPNTPLPARKKSLTEEQPVDHTPPAASQTNLWDQKIEGTCNQYSRGQDYRLSCTAIAAEFLNDAFDPGHIKDATARVDGIVLRGQDKYLKMIRSPDGSLPAQKPSLACAELNLEQDFPNLQGGATRVKDVSEHNFREMLMELATLSKGKSIGGILTHGGSSYALVVHRENENLQIAFFDSHGSMDHAGTSNAYVLFFGSKDSLDNAVQFLTQKCRPPEESQVEENAYAQFSFTALTPKV